MKRRYLNRFGNRDNRKSSGALWEATVSVSKDCLTTIHETNDEISDEIAQLIMVDLKKINLIPNGVSFVNVLPVILKDVEISVKGNINN